MLNAATTDGIVASAAQVYDDVLGQTQQEINTKILNGEGGVGGSDTSYVHVQDTDAQVWTIEHGMSRYPSVTIIDDEGNLIFSDMKYDNENQITISFSKAITGKAILN